MMSAMTAYQPVDPAAGLPATRVPLSQLTGRFLCRRVRTKFGPAALIELIDECRRVVCVGCHEGFDAQILTAEKIGTDAANIDRSGQCPLCRTSHESHLQFRKDGLILSRETDGWFIWLSCVQPNRYGNIMEEHLFWHSVDWMKRDAELAEDLNVPDETVREWRRKVGKPRTSKVSVASRRPRATTQSSDRSGI
jgi:hypothetical protein